MLLLCMEANRSTDSIHSSNQLLLASQNTYMFSLRMAEALRADDLVFSCLCPIPVHCIEGCSLHALGWVCSVIRSWLRTRRPCRRPTPGLRRQNQRLQAPRRRQVRRQRRPRRRKTERRRCAGTWSQYRSHIARCAGGRMTCCASVTMPHIHSTGFRPSPCQQWLHRSHN